MLLLYHSNECDFFLDLSFIAISGAAPFTTLWAVRGSTAGLEEVGHRGEPREVVEPKPRCTMILAVCG